MERGPKTGGSISRHGLLRYICFSMKKYLALTGLFFFVFAETDARQGFSAASSFNYGFIIPHRTSMAHLVTGHAYGYEFNLALPTDGSRPWHCIYNYPVTGVKIYHMSLGNDQVLGTATAVIPYIDFPLVRRERLVFSFALGSGLGYNSRHFNRISNHSNNAIGSGVNGIMHGCFSLSWNIASRLCFRQSLTITHFSNGGFQMPNLGINIPSLGAGIVYSLSPPSSFCRQNRDSLSLPDKNIRYTVIFTGGLKEVYPALGPRYAAYTVFAGAMKPLSFKSSLGGGANLFYDYSVKARMRIDDASAAVPEYKNFRLGVYISHELTVSRLSVIAQMGVYVLDYYRKDGPVYHRAGLLYRVNKNLVASFTLKTHYAKADYLEAGLGYVFMK